MKTETYTLPAHWACYLFYGDSSGLEENEAKEVDSFLEENKLGPVLTCSEEQYFSWHNDANNTGNDVLDYTFPINEQS